MKTANSIVKLVSPFLISLCVAVFVTNLQAAGSIKKGKSLTIGACAACHGKVGDSKAPAFPKLAGQNESYIVKQLSDFKKGTRKNKIMNGIVQSLSLDQMRDIAAFYQSQKVSVGKASAELASFGQKIFEGGNPRTNVPACSGCHSPTGAGNAPAKYPALAGQHALYTANQLKEFRIAAQLVLKLKGQKKEVPEKIKVGRSNDANSVMRIVVQDMTDAEIEAVSSYIEGLRVRKIIRKAKK